MSVASQPPLPDSPEPPGVPDSAALSPPQAAAFYTAANLRPDSSVGLLVKRAYQSILLQADRALAEHGLTHAQWVPLYRLHRDGPCTMACLAREQGQDPGAMTRAIDRLEAKGLVGRSRSDDDRRLVTLALTDAGRQLAEGVPPVLAQVLNQHLAGFSHDEWQLLLALLKRLVANGEVQRGTRAP